MKKSSVFPEIAGLTAEEAKARLFAEVEAKTRHESAKMIRQIETEAKETADRKAKEILCNVIQRYAGDYVNEQTVTAVFPAQRGYERTHHRS